MYSTPLLMNTQRTAVMHTSTVSAHRVELCWGLYEI